MKNLIPFPWKRLQLLFLNICEILGFLHSKNIIHRDLKPNNIIIDKYNNVKIIDFGCSRKTDNKKNRDTSLLGTPGYASPEQYGFSQTDQRTDIYSLGILIQEIVEKFNIDIDLNLKAVIEKCKRIDPDQRYANTMDIIKDIKSPKNSNATSKLFLKYLSYLLIPAIMILFIFFYNHDIAKTYKFKSEIVEEAVSIQIGKTPKDITIDDLKNITEINIWGENVISSYDDIIWESNSGDYVSLIIINGDSYFKRGEVNTLEDFKHMENLKTLTLVKQKINDVSPISSLKISHLFFK